MPGKLNERIIKAVNDCVGDDKILKAFILEILNQEKEKAKKWWYKEFYKSKIDEYIKRSGDNEI